MSFSIKPLQPGQINTWEKFVYAGNEGTIFHQLGFLEYHGDRFIDNEHHLVIYHGDTVFGVIPLAIFVKDGVKIAKSPYGASYGGPVFLGPLDYYDSVDIINILLAYLRSLAVSELRITLPIHSVYRQYSDTFRLALLENNFRCVVRDISSVVPFHVDIDIQSIITKRARNMARKAQKCNIEIVSHGKLEDFWHVLLKTYNKIEASPTHSFEEFSWLCQKFPDEVYANIGYLNEYPVAGIGHIVINPRVNSSFYLCTDPEYQDTQALSLLIVDTLTECQKKGFLYFDFGTSSSNQVGKRNLFQFKESFGAIGQFRETYLWVES